MLLMTKAIERAMPKLYSTESERYSKVIVKFFDPTGSWTWYVLEGAQEDGDWRFFGLVDGFEKELGYFMLSELQHAKDGMRGLQSLPIERDLWFNEGYVVDKVENKLLLQSQIPPQPEGAAKSE